MFMVDLDELGAWIMVLDLFVGSILDASGSGGRVQSCFKMAVGVLELALVTTSSRSAPVACAGDVSESWRRVHELLEVVAHGHSADRRERHWRLEPREQRAAPHDACDDARHAQRRAVRERVLRDRVCDCEHACAEERHAERSAAHE
ncbi:hypothetical protein PybrP1_008745 [[Pythium] brassicae (nom. inval.)]|nr:hypothetical protein PybrP1_008745 [[Pythium] brassicae (nom. inval.)]